MEEDEIEEQQASQPNIGGLHNDAERYLEAYQVFLEKCESEEEMTKRWLQDEGPGLVARCKVPAKTAFNVLGMGSGAGHFDAIILHAVLDKYDQVFCRVVEPREEDIDQFKHLLEDDEQLKTVAFEWHQQTDEEYFEQTFNDDTKFHIVHAIQLLYYVDDLAGCIKHMYRQVAEGGLLVIIHLSDQTGCSNLMKKMNKFLPDGDEQTPYRTTAHIKEVLDKLQLQYTTDRLNVNTDITECFVPGSETGILLLDFLTHTPHFTDTVDPEDQREITDYIRGPDCSVEQDGKILFNNSSEIIVIPKLGDASN
ncbi:PREDICTED: histamine N-methyltransferase-like [Branchiostoma belcheri]|uniref:Histamine N-methyltransferase-like n=1 Tax=Branchiostoma belcheri TaxID=7741 RepID=A0A6P4Z4Y7_BRABE|nr:PREDICTED: histamine N-methyltransferase-like [Branchiostoma belcheri]